MCVHRHIKDGPDSACWLIRHALCMEGTTQQTQACTVKFSCKVCLQALEPSWRCAAVEVYSIFCVGCDRQVC